MVETFELPLMSPGLSLCRGFTESQTRFADQVLARIYACTCPGAAQCAVLGKEKEM